MSPNAAAYLTFDFRDWKYLSQIERFQVDIDDADILAGLKEGNITIDFDKMTQRDLTNGTKFEVGGRMFFEANLFGTDIYSFTTNGFLDKLGYQEPVKKVTAATKILNNLWWILLVLAAVSSAGYVYCKGQRKKKADERLMREQSN